ncbi:hypothetical protein [Actinomadura rubrisoli]|uniref:Uncharacterized protein n=1 Tax=Actinomadura rubrisoli TaxID=2530368 RepID=A0A4R5CFV0_9ACTN|nr:hypothetical protein [Actinomadura rubrisoli]TDD97163.1 hypothetical protein E1298_01635 [Actinomadura rubrisoli]
MPRKWERNRSELRVKSYEPKHGQTERGKVESDLNHTSCNGSHWDPVTPSEIAVEDEIAVRLIQMTKHPITGEHFGIKGQFIGTVREVYESAISVEAGGRRMKFVFAASATCMKSFEKQFSCKDADARSILLRVTHGH